MHDRESKLSSDILLFVSDDADKEYIRTNMKLAHQVRTVIKYAPAGEAVARMLINDCIAIACLKRNSIENPLVQAVFASPVEEDDANIVDAIKGKLLGTPKQ